MVIFCCDARGLTYIYSYIIQYQEGKTKHHLNIFRVIWGDRKTANFDEHMTEQQ
jgi:hypothetical protein